MARLYVAAVLLAAVCAASRAAKIDPRYAANITVYHVSSHTRVPGHSQQSLTISKRWESRPSRTCTITVQHRHMLTLTVGACLLVRFCACSQVNEKSRHVPPENMNTANINGDIYFDLRTSEWQCSCMPFLFTRLQTLALAPGLFFVGACAWSVTHSHCVRVAVRCATRSSCVCNVCSALQPQPKAKFVDACVCVCTRSRTLTRLHST
jgi:hypothetical protein